MSANNRQDQENMSAEMCVDLSPELLARLAIKASQEGKTVNEVLNESLLHWVREQSGDADLSVPVPGRGKRGRRKS